MTTPCSGAAAGDEALKAKAGKQLKQSSWCWAPKSKRQLRERQKAGQASGETLGLKALGRGSDWTLHSRKGGWGQVSGAEGESGKHLLPGPRWKQVPTEAAASGGQELCSDHSSSSDSSERNGQESASSQIKKSRRAEGMRAG